MPHEKPIPDAAPLLTDERRPLLEWFPEARRSLVTNLFLQAVRRRERTAEDVLLAVKNEMVGRRTDARRRGNGREEAKAAALLWTVNANAEEALAFARWALDWEAAPPADRERAKQVRAEEGVKAWMGRQPATERQLAFLARLGHRGPVGDRQRASELIDRLLGEQRGQVS